MADFDGRPGAAVVAGASGGIGEAICRLLADRGADVALTFKTNAKSATSVAEAVKSKGRRARSWQLSLQDHDAVRSLVAEVVQEFGAIHSVIYAAGPHVPQMYVATVTPEMFARQLQLDAGGFFNLAHFTIGELRKTRGSVVAITTTATQRYAARDSLSAAPKSAVQSLVRGLAVEEGKHGVRANCVAPGMLSVGLTTRLIETGDFDDRALDAVSASIPLRRFGTALDVAEAVCFLASERARYVTGVTLEVDGGYHAG